MSSTTASLSLSVTRSASSGTPRTVSSWLAPTSRRPRSAERQLLCNDVDERIDVERLLDVAISVERLGDRRRLRIRSQEDDPRTRARIPPVLRHEGPAIHDRHRQIDEDEI